VLISRGVQVCQAKSNDSYLHLFVRASDVRFGQLSTSNTSVSFGNLKHLEEGSTPTSARNEISSLSRSASTDECALQAVEQAVSEQAAAETVLHIVIRKTSHVSWNTARSGEFELSVRATDTADQLKEQLKQRQLLAVVDGQNNINVEDIDFYHCGVRLLADRPLLEYGLQQGDVLDIVPWEPTVSIPATPRDSSEGGKLVPLLSSPSHELNMIWQKAADGLKAGVQLPHVPLYTSLISLLTFVVVECVHCKPSV
jgi:Ubiquitin family